MLYINDELIILIICWSFQKNCIYSLRRHNAIWESKRTLGIEISTFDQPH